MGKIKLVALDLDGTTLDSKGKLPPDVKETLEEAISKGIYIIFATGRAFSAISQEVLNIKGIRFVLSSNGARVVDLFSCDVIYENYLDPFAVLDMYETLKKFRYIYEVFTGGKAYVDRSHYEDLKTAVSISERHTNYVLKTRNPVDDVLEFMKDNREKIENININFTDMDKRLEMREILAKKTNITLTNSFDHNLEIGGLTTGKGDAVKKVSRILGVRKEEIMAIGDNPNDISMLKVAGLPIAVANAKEEVLQYAKDVTLSNDQGGVGEAIKKWVLQ